MSCELIKTRTAKQIRSHAQKYFIKSSEVDRKQLKRSFQDDNGTNTMHRIPSISNNYKIKLTPQEIYNHQPLKRMTVGINLKLFSNYFKYSLYFRFL